MKRARRGAYVGILVAVLIGAGFFLIGGWQSFAGPYPKYEERSLKRSEEAYQANERVNQMLIEAWWRYQLFTRKWWFNFGMATVPWFVWAWLRPRASTHRVLYVGLYYIIIASYLGGCGFTSLSTGRGPCECHAAMESARNEKNIMDLPPFDTEQVLCAGMIGPISLQQEV